jgi:hypothetical protein
VAALRTPAANGRRENRQISVLAKAVLEVGLDADGAVSLIGGNNCRGSVILRLVLGGNAGGLRRVVEEIRKEFESRRRRHKRHGVTVRYRQRWPAVIEVRVKRSAAEVIQDLPFHDGQINQRGIAEVKIGTRELLVIVREHRCVCRVGIQVLLGRNPRNRRKMDVRVDEA